MNYSPTHSLEKMIEVLNKIAGGHIPAGFMREGESKADFQERIWVWSQQQAISALLLAPSLLEAVKGLEKMSKCKEFAWCAICRKVIDTYSDGFSISGKDYFHPHCKPLPNPPTKESGDE